MKMGERRNLGKSNKRGSLLRSDRKLRQVLYNTSLGTETSYGLTGAPAKLGLGYTVASL